MGLFDKFEEDKKKEKGIDPWGAARELEDEAILEAVADAEEAEVEAEPEAAPVRDVAPSATEVAKKADRDNLRAKRK